MASTPYIESLTLNVSSDGLSAPLTMSIPLNNLNYNGSNSIQITNSNIVNVFNSANMGQQFSSSLVVTYGGLNLEVAGFEGLSNTVTSSPYTYTPRPVPELPDNEIKIRPPPPKIPDTPLNQNP
jgi:hypothetical protein